MNKASIGQEKGWDELGAWNLYFFTSVSWFMLAWTIAWGYHNADILADQPAKQPTKILVDDPAHIPSQSSHTPCRPVSELLPRPSRTRSLVVSWFRTEYPIFISLPTVLMRSPMWGGSQMQCPGSCFVLSWIWDSRSRFNFIPHTSVAVQCWIMLGTDGRQTGPGKWFGSEKSYEYLDFFALLHRVSSLLGCSNKFWWRSKSGGRDGCTWGY